MILSRENYRHGFLVDDEALAGVAPLEGVGFAAYVSSHASGETLAYREFATADEALAYLAAIDRPWVYEAIGCRGSCGSHR